MERELRLVWLYCVIEEAVRQILGEARLRSRGPTPALTDVEALTIEIFGETLGLNSDASPRRDHRIGCDLFMRRLTKKLAVPSVSDVPTREPARWRSASLTSQAL